MGWNDRLPEDPYWPDQESYDGWQEYHQELLRAELEQQTQNGPGLTSQNIDPGQAPTEEHTRADTVRETLTRFLAKFTGSLH